ncbi:hypothetical protein [Xanthomonas campestris]|uniref:hypothetical protein n=1 Tax=Xanthomonas campestris TaxID=339 RepID=UPI000E325DD0|nr:hypothetical protein [Xanthomonas campestris]RFF50177.1 hypothetical protein D0A35_10935 [Xanthomonas campestris]
MRADRSRRLAALEARPALRPPSAAEIAFGDALEALYESHSGLVDPSSLHALHHLQASSSLQDIAAAWVDFIEAVEQIDAQAGARLNHLLNFD